MARSSLTPQDTAVRRALSGLSAVLALGAVWSGCIDGKHPTAPEAPESNRVADPRPRDGGQAPPSDGSADAPPDGAPQREAPPLPPGLVPGTPAVVDVPGDRPIHVVHGEPGTRKALVYLHGLCGDVTAMYSWAKMASRYGTVIGMLADQECDVPGRYRWTLYIAGIDARIDRALDVVREQRGGRLETKTLTVIGYSQGASRAAALAQRFPEKYPRVVIAGAPSKPRVTRVGLARVVAVVGGERESTDHMVRGVADLSRAGKKAKFFLLPEAAHGEYGPEGTRVMEEALRFVLGPPGS